MNFMSVMIHLEGESQIFIEYCGIASCVSYMTFVGVKCLLEYQLKAELLCRLPIPKITADDWA